MAWSVARPGWSVLAAVVVSSAVGGGCTATSRPRVPDPAGVVYSGRLATDAVYFAGSVVLVPPGQAKPTLTWQQAVRHCHGGCDLGTHPHVILAIATTPQTGTLRADGTTKPGTDNVLSYVVIAKDQQCRSSGGPADVSGRPLSTMTTAMCDTVELIDADTGKIEYDAYGKQ